jgi:hypothetical protein
MDTQPCNSAPDPNLHSIVKEQTLQPEITTAKRFRSTKEYLLKMTKPELIALGAELRFNDLALWATPGVVSFIFEVLGRKRNAKPESLKKDELIRCFLESGVDLKGKVPAEIYDVQREETL